MSALRGLGWSSVLITYDLTRRLAAARTRPTATDVFMFTHVERSMSWKLRAKKILADVAASVIGLVVLELSD
jgi:hypothetical protein